jgi:integrase
MNAPNIKRSIVSNARKPVISVLKNAGTWQRNNTFLPVGTNDCESLRKAQHARMAILTGFRQAEQFRLQWKDVGWERGILTLPTTKVDEVQYVHLNEEAKAILRGLDSWPWSKWIFPSDNRGTPLDARNFYNCIRGPAVTRAGIEWATWHDLRHTFASRMAMNGQNEGTIAALFSPGQEFLLNTQED